MSYSNPPKVGNQIKDNRCSGSLYLSLKACGFWAAAVDCCLIKVPLRDKYPKKVWDSRTKHFSFQTEVHYDKACAHGAQIQQMPTADESCNEP